MFLFFIFSHCLFFFPFYLWKSLPLLSLYLKGFSLCLWCSTASLWGYILLFLVWNLMYFFDLKIMHFIKFGKIHHFYPIAYDLPPLSPSSPSALNSIYVRTSHPLPRSSWLSFVLFISLSLCAIFWVMFSYFLFSLLIVSALLTEPWFKSLLIHFISFDFCLSLLTSVAGTGNKQNSLSIPHSYY